MGPNYHQQFGAIELASRYLELLRTANPATGEHYTPREAWPIVAERWIGPNVLPEEALRRIREARRVIVRTRELEQRVQAMQPGQTFAQARGRLGVQSPTITVQFTVTWYERYAGGARKWEEQSRTISHDFLWTEGRADVDALARQWLMDYAEARPQTEIQFTRAGVPNAGVSITGVSP